MSSPLSHSTRSDMKGAAGWIKFVGVCFIIIAAMMLILGLMAVSAGGGDGGIYVLILIGIGAALGAMGYLLMLYSNNLMESAEQGKLQPLENGLTRLKSYFIIWGIIVIISACTTLYQFTL